MICKDCSKKLRSGSKSGYCRDCRKRHEDANRISHWLKTGDTGYAIQSTIRGVIRDYIYKEQDYKCAICNLPNVWNNQELHFILDHIDGDASNGERSNLRLICPNCDSQLDTYKSRNRNSARVSRF